MKTISRTKLGSNQNLPTLVTVPMGSKIQETLFSSKWNQKISNSTNPTRENHHISKPKKNHFFWLALATIFNFSISFSVLLLHAVLFVVSLHISVIISFEASSAIPLIVSRWSQPQRSWQVSKSNIWAFISKYLLIHFLLMILAT